MAIRTALLNGNNINKDTDFSKYIESVSEPGVIEGLEVSATKVGIGKARVPCERTNGETIYALVYITSEVSISGNGEVYIKVNQTYVDDGELANEDGTGIATVEVGTMPSKNALKLATITSGVPTDERNMIKKVGELNTQINSIFDSIDDLDTRVEHLEEQGAVDHLEESGIVGELYTLEDKLFKQYTPTLADSTLDCNVSDTSANTEIHIQRMGSGTASNQLKLKLKMVGSSTQNLKVEVRKGVKVEVSSSEAYWYGDEVIASGSIAYSEISSDYAEKTITLDANFGGTKGELLDIVVYMDIVNASNYYCLACDSAQYSEGFGYVSVNGSTRVRSKLMPYGISEGFSQSMLCKEKEIEVFSEGAFNGNSAGTSKTFTVEVKGRYVLNMIKCYGNGYGYKYSIKVNDITVGEFERNSDYREDKAESFKHIIDLEVGDIVVYTIYGRGSGTGFCKGCSAVYQTQGNGIPKDIYSIGENGYIIIWGMNDREFFTQSLDMDCLLSYQNLLTDNPIFSGSRVNANGTVNLTIPTSTKIVVLYSNEVSSYYQGYADRKSFNQMLTKGCPYGGVSFKDASSYESRLDFQFSEGHLAITCTLGTSRSIYGKVYYKCF